MIVAPVLQMLVGGFNHHDAGVHHGRAEREEEAHLVVDTEPVAAQAVEAALLKAAEANPNITLLPGQSCIDLITGRNQVEYSGSGRIWGAYALDEASEELGRYVMGTNYSSGLCMSEIAWMAAQEVQRSGYPDAYE